MNRESDLQGGEEKPEIPPEEVNRILSMQKHDSPGRKKRRNKDLGVINFISLIIVYLVWMVLNWLANMALTALLSPTAYRAFLESRLMVFGFIGVTIVLAVLVTIGGIRPLLIRGW